MVNRYPFKTRWLLHVPPVITDSSVGIGTRYELGGPEIESRWGARFPAPVQTCPGAYPTSYTMGTGSFPVVKRPGRRVDHPPPSIAEVKERVEIYYSSLWAFVVCFKVEFTTRFNTHELYVLPTQCIYVFCVDLRPKQ